MDFVEPEYNAGEIDRAGKLIAREKTGSGFVSIEHFDAVMVFENWRSSHSYPMQVIRNNLANRARSVDKNALIAQRLKRFESIVSKLRREPTMKFSQMQDIGGCRAILSTVGQVEELLRIHQEAWNKNPNRHILHRCKNYIEQPKPSGYRGIHLIYKFKSLQNERSVHNSQRIEIQLRSRLQHVWATAVEVVGAFTNEALKSSQGSEDWQRLFALMGSVLAIRERRALVPNTPDRPELYLQIKKLSEKIRAEEFLAGCSTAAVHVEQRSVKAEAFLLVLNVRTRRVNVRPFKTITEAGEEYNLTERRNEGKDYLQTVLVSVDSIGALKTAYPNYYLDVSQFLLELRRILSLELR
jgi:ppGpp synthetase/RelA/SpoT-type nucleotidyltranferase